MILALTPNPMLDLLAEIRLEPGRIQRVDAFRRIIGGKGLNMGRVLARHGHRVAALGFLGGAAGEVVGRLARADGLEDAHTPIAGETRMGFVAVDPAGGNTSLMERGPAIAETERDALLNEMERRLPVARLVLVGGAPPPGEVCRGLYAQVLKLCAAARVPCWVDAYGPAMDAALACPHPPALAKPNREELAATPGAWQRVEELHISDGPAPIELRCPGGRFRVMPPAVREVNQVGSGDSYVAALAHARLSGWPLERQLAYAAAAGAANAARADVAMIGPAEIEPLVGQVRIEGLP